MASRPRARTPRNGLSMMIHWHLVILAAAAQDPPPNGAGPGAGGGGGSQIDMYPKFVWCCVGGFIAFVSICHFLGLFASNWRQALPPAASSSHRDDIYYRRLPTAFMHTFRAIAFRLTLSLGDSYTINLAEMFLTAAYLAILLSWAFVNSTSLEGVKLDPNSWANSAGQIAASQVPLIVALGMKNNVISFLTGIGMNRLNVLHRMTARALWVLLWVHAGGRIKIGVFSYDLAESWVRCGILALSSLTVLCIISIRPVRQRTYEVFLIVHFLLSLIFVLGAYFHSRENNFGYYVWPAILLLGLDRLVRILRLAVYNFSYVKGKRSTELDAHVDVLSHDFLRITFHRPNYLTWAPGQTAYITIPGVAAFQSHPFTISTIDTRGLPLTKAATDFRSKLSDDNAGIARKLAFLVRVRKGFTARLLDAAQDNQSLMVLFEGPYCSPPSLCGYDTVILIAGGSGVSFTLPLLLHLIHCATKENAPCNRVIFLWVIRDASHFEWISDVLLPAIQIIPTSIAVEIRLFITSFNQNLLPIDRFSDSSSAVVTVKQGRPDVVSLIKGEISRAAGDISINVCGPISLAGSVRAALRDPRPMDILRGGPNVVLHVETFGF